MLLTLIDQTVLTADTRSYTFRPAEKFVFAPGQFVQLRQVGADQKYARAFSIASAPHADAITFLMKYNPAGHVSGFLETAPPGTQLEMGAPLGRFVLDAADSARVCIATGTGIAPIMSFIESGAHPKILFGARDEASLFWTEKLPKNARITLSQPAETWQGLRGRVTEYVPQLIKENPDATWYLCGNPEMVKEVRVQLQSAHIAPTKIHFEIY